MARWKIVDEKGKPVGGGEGDTPREVLRKFKDYGFADRAFVVEGSVIKLLPSLPVPPAPLEPSSPPKRASTKKREPVAARSRQNFRPIAIRFSTADLARLDALREELVRKGRLGVAEDSRGWLIRRLVEGALEQVEAGKLKL